MARAERSELYLLILACAAAGHENHVVGAPSEAYVKTIMSGLKEIYPCMRNSKILAYLSSTEGICKAISEDTLTEWLSSL